MEKLLLTFENPKTADDWKTVDDVVMGGRSHSRVCWLDEPVAGASPEREFLELWGQR